MCKIGHRQTMDINKHVHEPSGKIVIFANPPTLTFSAVSSSNMEGGRRSPAVACWASDHWVASSNPVIKFLTLTHQWQTYTMI